MQSSKNSKKTTDAPHTVFIELAYYSLTFLRKSCIFVGEI